MIVLISSSRLLAKMERETQNKITNVLPAP